MHTRLRAAALPAALGLVGILVYANGLAGPFLFDDAGAIVENRHLRALWPPGLTLTAPPDTALAGRPLVALSLAINYALGGLDVSGYHLFNVGVHVLCGLALYGCVRRTLGGGDLVAGCCALVWLVHPLNTEVVDYVVQRTESLMALCYVGTLYGAIRACGERHRVAWSAAAVLACAFGMLAKESMVTAPLAVVLYDRAYGPRWPERGALSLGLAATWGVPAALWLAAPRPRSVGFHLGVSALEYAANQLLVIPHYLRLAVWPHPLRFDYGWPRELTAGDALPGAVVLGLLLAVAVALYLRRPAAGFPALWFFLTLAPTSSFVPIATEVGAERRMYLPLMGLVVLAVAGAFRLARHLGRRGALVAVAGVLGVALALGWATHVRNADYRSAVTIWDSAVRAAPRNSRAYSGLGRALQEQGRIDEAVERYRQALALEPGDALACYNLGTALAARGRSDAAIEAYRKALALQPDHALALNNLGSELARRGRLAEAVEPFRRATVLAPEMVEAWHNLGRALRLAGRGAEALAPLREAMRLDPERPGPIGDAAWILATSADAELRNPAEAVRLAQRAVELTGGQDATMLDTLAAAWAAAGRFDEAVALARRALELASSDGTGVKPQEVRERLEGYARGTAYHEPL